MRILLALALMVSGFFITWKSEWLYQNFGTIPFFDKYLGNSGGGRLGYKLFGILFSFVGILVLTNLHARLLTAFANLLIPGQ